jgi:hypothetical protein
MSRRLRSFALKYKALCREDLMLKSLVVIASLTLSWPAVAAPPTLLDRARGAEAEGHTARALGLAEVALQKGAGAKDRRAFGIASGFYWTLVKREGDFPRAAHFFTQLAREHAASPDVLASEAAALGAYLGWLASSGALELPREGALLEALDRRARAGDARALGIEPDNFMALFGLAIHELHTPGGEARARDAFARLNALRPGHPEYPWSEVDAWQNSRRPR